MSVNHLLCQTVAQYNVDILQRILLPTNASNGTLDTPGVLTERIIFDQKTRSTEWKPSYDVVYFNGIAFHVGGK